MKFVDKVIYFFEKIFKRKKVEIKMISAPQGTDKEKDNFINSLKVNLKEKTRNKVETLMCYGDGLGIKQPMKY